MDWQRQGLAPPAAVTAATARVYAGRILKGAKTGRIPKIRPVQLRISGLVDASTCCRGRWIKDNGVRVEKAIAAYASAAYQEALKALGDGAARDIRIVEALDQ